MDLATHEVAKGDTEPIGGFAVDRLERDKLECACKRSQPDVALTADEMYEGPTFSTISSRPGATLGRGKPDRTAMTE